MEMTGNLLIVHGGGPTAVLNASLYGVIRQAQAEKEVDKIYGAIGGSEAILAENFLDIGNMPDEKIELLLNTPGTAIGSSRFPLEQEQYEAMVSILKNTIYGMCYSMEETAPWILAARSAGFVRKRELLS